MVPAVDVTPVTVFYHVWAAGQWQAPFGEFLSAAADAGLPGRLHVGIIGTPAERGMVTEWLRAHHPGLDWVVAAEADSGFEEVTLMAVGAYAAVNDGAVLYMHDKGSYTPGGFEVQWRRRVTDHLVTRWRECVARLGSADAVGCHWLSPAQLWPRPWPLRGRMVGVTHPHFSGNFWWADCRYLRRLPPWPFTVPHYDGCCYPGSVPKAVGESTGRWLAELWIGLGDPLVADVHPGMPGERGCEILH